MLTRLYVKFPSSDGVFCGGVYPVTDVRAYYVAQGEARARVRAILEDEGGWDSPFDNLIVPQSWLFAADWFGQVESC